MSSSPPNSSSFIPFGTIKSHTCSKTKVLEAQQFPLFEHQSWLAGANRNWGLEAPSEFWLVDCWRLVTSKDVPLWLVLSLKSYRTKGHSQLLYFCSLIYIWHHQSGFFCRQERLIRFSPIIIICKNLPNRVSTICRQITILQFNNFNHF